jgi:hypothetical protein
MYERDKFLPFSQDAGRVIANLESAYNAWLETQQAHGALAVSMFWQTKNDTDYLAIKQDSLDPGTTAGPRSAETEQRFRDFTSAKAALNAKISASDQVVRERARQYRAMRLPALPDRQSEILRKLDIEGLLRNDLLVVGTNAFAAYELVCNARFPVGNEETEDFDLAWCRDTRVSLASIAPAQANKARPTLFALLRTLDRSYRINARKPYQAVNDDGYEVELLAAPSTHPLPNGEAFDPMASSLIEQE